MTRLAARASALAAVAVLHAQDPAPRIDAWLRAQVEEARIPGLAVAVVRDGKPIFSNGYGVREVGKEERLSPEHVLHFASVAKPFVATAIVQLVEQGKVELDAPVLRYLPYFRLADERYREITVRQMLNHTSGMPDEDDYEWDRPQLDAGAAERYVRSMAAERLLSAPGQRHRYSNMAFDVLGDLIAKASGVSFEEYVRTHILEPVGMSTATFVYPDVPDALRTTGHVGQAREPSSVYPYNRRHAPCGCLNASVADMARWMIVNLNRGQIDGRRILQDQSYDLLWTPTCDIRAGMQIGLSWFIRTQSGHRMLWHEGADRGFRSYIMLLPDAGLGIVLASNWYETDIGALALGILGQLLELGPGADAHRATTEHYEVAAAQSEAWAQNLAEGLEHMLGEFRRTLGVDGVPAERMRVFVFADPSSYNEFGELYGDAHSSFYGSFYARSHPDRPVAAVWDHDATNLRRQITHGAVHQYLDRAFPGAHAPAFVQEGLAAYFSTYWDYDASRERLQYLRGRHEYVPLDKLLTDPIAQYGSHTNERLVELGMLFYYLLRYREDTRTTQPDEPEQRGPFRDYLLALLRGQDVSGTPMHELIGDPATLGQAFAAYEFPK